MELQERFPDAFFLETFEVAAVEAVELAVWVSLVL
jgi:hypothetical protein